MTVTVAPVWRRALAALVDLIPVLGLWVLATWAIVQSDPSPPEIPPWNPLDRVVDYIQLRPGRTVLVLLALFAIHIAWTFLWTRYATATPGHRALGLRVVDRAARAPTAGRLLAWLALRIPSTFVAGLGLWWALVDTERRTLHDRGAGVWVVVRR